MAVKASSLAIKKNPEKSGAWLAKHQWYIGDGTTGRGETYSAWTTLAAAKRWAAAQVGRSRLTWKEISETELTATHSEKA
jgi:hypothetical protein